MNATQRVHCPIQGFTVWSPDGDSWLDYDWTELPKTPTPSRSASHLPLRVRLNRQGREIEKQETDYLRARLAALFVELREQEEQVTAELEGVILDSFRQSLIRRQLGCNL